MAEFQGNDHIVASWQLMALYLVLHPGVPVEDGAVEVSQQLAEAALAFVTAASVEWGAATPPGTNQLAEHLAKKLRIESPEIEFLPTTGPGSDRPVRVCVPPLSGEGRKICFTLKQTGQII